jgi:hypothetical protein
MVLLPDTPRAATPARPAHSLAIIAIALDDTSANAKLENLHMLSVHMSA